MPMSIVAQIRILRMRKDDRCTEEPGRCPYCGNSDTGRSDSYSVVRSTSNRISITMHCWNCHKDFVNWFIYAETEKFNEAGN